MRAGTLIAKRFSRIRVGFDLWNGHLAVDTSRAVAPARSPPSKRF